MPFNWNDIWRWGNWRAASSKSCKARSVSPISLCARPRSWRAALRETPCSTALKGKRRLLGNPRAHRAAEHRRACRVSNACHLLLPCSATGRSSNTPASGRTRTYVRRKSTLSCFECEGFRYRLHASSFQPKAGLSSSIQNRAGQERNFRQKLSQCLQSPCALPKLSRAAIAGSRKSGSIFRGNQQGAYQQKFKTQKSPQQRALFCSIEDIESRWSYDWCPGEDSNLHGFTR